MMTRKFFLLLLVSVILVATAGHSTVSLYNDDSSGTTSDKQEVYPIAIDEDHFPDSAFRALLMTYNWASDGLLTEEEANGMTLLANPLSPEFKNTGVKSLKGIEFFPQLMHLDFSGHQLTEVDISKNTELTILELSNNQLISIDLSNNLNLIDIHLSDNRLTTIDLSKNESVVDVWLQNNQLISLDLSGLTNLEILYCFGNQIKGEAMDALIASLRSTDLSHNLSSPALLYGINTDDPNEGNVITKAQVASAQAKGWKVRDWVNRYGDDEYLGSDEFETTVRSVTSPNPGASPVIYDLQGRRLLAKPQKGVYIQNGKKIVVK